MMKKYVHDVINDIYCGVQIKRHPNSKKVDIDFNFDSDNIADIMYLTKSIKHDTFNDIDYIYGYEFVNTTSRKERNLVLDYIQGKGIYTETRRNYCISELVSRGITRLDEINGGNNLQTYGAIVHMLPSHSGRSIVSRMADEIESTAKPSSITSIALVKDTWEHIELDEQFALSILKKKYGRDTRRIDDEMESLRNDFKRFKSNCEIHKLTNNYSIRDFCTRANLQSAFLNILKFDSEQDENLWKGMYNESKALLYDDMIVSGATLTEALRCLRDINPDVNIDVFVLIRNRRNN